MDRRDFLTARRRKQIPVATPAPSPSPQTDLPATQGRTNTGINPYTGPWTEQEIIHLLKRTMFGAKKADIDYFKTRTVSQAVDELMNPTAPQPAPPVKEYATNVNAVRPDSNIAQGTTWINDINNDGTVQGQRTASYKKWFTGNLINQDGSIREKL